MPKSNNQKKFLELRKKFPWFSYEKFTWTLSEKGLEAEFQFDLSGVVTFRPRIFIPKKSWFLPSAETKELLPGILFRIGLIEMISYWKAACPPIVKVNPGTLGAEEIVWWKKVWYNGMGEFFYLNSIDNTIDDFITVQSVDNKPYYPVRADGKGIIVPVGGGKDSAVTLELLGSLPGTIPLIMNPRGATLQTIYKAGFKDEDYIEIHRTIDPELLRLNDQGYLNGHTPFSALLAFVTVLAAILSGRKFIALSNESSANETTIPGTSVNHQYSKSVEFEKDFREYIRRFVAPGIEYFSFLRPLNELQIARLFSGFEKYHGIFRSCNAGSKEDVWCGKCAKCLFTYIILSPFLPAEKMRLIFGKDLLEDAGLIPLLDQLTGRAEEKPFDCVGTISEVNLALFKTIRKHGGEKLPSLLEYYRKSPLYKSYCDKGFDEALTGFSDDHQIPSSLIPILTSALND